MGNMKRVEVSDAMVQITPYCSHLSDVVAILFMELSDGQLFFISEHAGTISSQLGHNMVAKMPSVVSRVFLSIHES